jgi:hypothetical protein
VLAYGPLLRKPKKLPRQPPQNFCREHKSLGPILIVDLDAAAPAAGSMSDMAIFHHCQTHLAALVGNGQPGKVTLMENRISILEKFKERTLGYVGAITAIGTTLGELAHFFLKYRKIKIWCSARTRRCGGSLGWETARLGDFARAKSWLVSIKARKRWRLGRFEISKERPFGKRPI